MINGNGRSAMDLLLQRDPESWSRLKGLIAMLELPNVGISKHYVDGRPRRIEILSTDGEWHRITEVKLSDNGELVCTMVSPTGDPENPVRREWRFDSWVVPAWRTADGFDPHEDRTMRATLEPK